MAEQRYRGKKKRSSTVPSPEQVTLRHRENDNCYRQCRGFRYIIMPLLVSLALSYGLVLVSPGPNLLIVLRVAVKPSLSRSLSVAAGIASGAAVASYLAVIGAKALTLPIDLDKWASIGLSSILLYSAVRLARRPSERLRTEDLAENRPNFRLFGLGLATALCNPLSVPFFLSIYVSHPDFRTSLGGVASCLIFLMAFCWFTLVGRVFAIPALQRIDQFWAGVGKNSLAAVMAFYSVTLIYRHLP